MIDIIILLYYCIYIIINTNFLLRRGAAVIIYSSSSSSFFSSSYFFLYYYFFTEMNEVFNNRKQYRSCLNTRQQCKNWWVVGAESSRRRDMGEPSSCHGQRRLAGIENVGIIKEQFVKERKRISDQLMATMTPEFVKNIERSKGQMQDANNAPTSGKDIKLDPSDLFNIDESALPPLQLTYPDLNEIQRFRLRIAVQQEVDKRMQKFNKRMDRQFRNSNEAGFVSASSNNIRRRTAVMVYRQRNIDMKEVERAAYLTLVKSTKTISALFQPDPKDKLDFHDLSGADKWKRVFKQKHWKAFTKDPNARTRNSSEQTFDNFHNFRVNLPFRKPDIKGWANKHSDTCSIEKKRESTKAAKFMHRNPNLRGALSTAHQQNTGEKHIMRRMGATFETRSICRRNTIPSLTSTNVMGYYSGSDSKEAKQKAHIIHKISRARHKKYGTLDPEYTLITWDMKTNGVARKTFETSKFMSSDFVAKPYNPMDRMDDHVKSVPALPVTSFFSDETYNLQSRPRANSMEMESKLAPRSQLQSQKRKHGRKSI